MSSLKTSRLSLSVHAGTLRNLEVHEQPSHPGIETGQLITVEPAIGGNRNSSNYLQLIQKLSSVRSALPGAGAFVFTAANRGDGVSFVVNSLAGELARVTGERVLRAPASILGEDQFTVSLPGGHSAVSDQGEVYAVKPREAHSGNEASGNWEARRVAGNLLETRRHFGWVLIDCPSLRESEQALALAPHTDGVVLVVAADQTKRAEIARAQRSIQLSSGALLGLVLNKRTYPVPDFLYQRL